MDDATLDMSADLRDELAANDVKPIVDPRSVPVRFSTLKQLGRSPAHYFHAVQDEREETLAMRLGAGVHAMLFGQPLVKWDQPAKKGSGKAPRNGSAWEAFLQANAGATILNAAEWSQAEAVVASIRSNRPAMDLLDGAELEQRIDWSFLGRSCRSTPDARTPRYLVDLKTTKTAEPDRFARQSMWLGYHAQLAFYLDAVRESGLGTPTEAYVIAVESAPPHPVTVLRLTERAIEQGRRLCRLWFERLLTCEAANQWPGYAQSVVDLDVPDDDVALVFAEPEAA